MPKLNTRILFLAIILLGLLLRLQHLNRVFRENLVVFNGFDSYYHLRLAEVIVKSGQRIGFDSYLNYPHGLNIAWLPLYHWVIAFPGLIFGFNATEAFAALLPVIMGLIAIATIYFISMEIFENRFVAIISAFLAALTPKLVSTHSIGSSDYHGWNVAIFLLSVLFFLRGVNREEKKETNFLFSGIFLAILSASWLGGSIYASIIAIITVLAIRYGRMDYRGIILAFFPSVLASSFVSFSSKFGVLQLSLPYLAILLFLLVVWLVNLIAERKAISAFEGESGIREETGEKVKGKKSKAKKVKSRFELEEEKKRIISKYKNVATLLTIIIGIAVIFILYTSSFPIIRLGINYILGISPYLPTIAEARSFQILLVIIETGMFAFLIAIPFSIYHFLKMEKNSLYLFSWFVLAFILSMLQVRFDEVLVPVAIIYASYGICYLLQASNVPIFEVEPEPDESVERKKRKKKERLEKKKKSDLIWGKTEIAYSLVIILFISSTGLFFSFTEFDLNEDWLSALLKLKEISPPTSDYLNPVKKPEYGILSWWDYGNWILYIAKRPVVCNNFQAGAIDAAKFFTTDNETLAKEILEKRGVRYIITDDKMMLGNETFKGKFKAIMRIAGLNTQDSAYVLEVYKKSMFYRLHVGTGVEGIKLISKHGSVKVFEVVS
ncbi:hypothetical protein DRP07_02840 [Archaeoglobales archaeon]|nr:MAG: hypothetical protein DRP07_02840 [Archaeoglobales archaeon]